MDASSIAEQMLLGGGAESAAPAEEVPPEIAAALAIVSGNATPEDGGGMEGIPGTTGESRAANAQERWQMSMLKKHELKNAYTILSEPKIRVLDIATPEGEEEMAAIYQLIGDPKEGYIGHETPAKIVLDPKAPRGFRCLVVIKYWKPITKAGKPPQYESIGSALEQLRQVKDGTSNLTS